MVAPFNTNVLLDDVKTVAMKAEQKAVTDAAGKAAKKVSTDLGGRSATSAAGVLAAENGSNMLGTTVGVAYKVQNVSFFSSIGAMLVGGIGTFTGINSIKSFARKMNVGAHLSDYTPRDVGDALRGVKVKQFVSAGVKTMAGNLADSVNSTVSPFADSVGQATAGRGFSIGFLDKWARNRGMRNALTSVTKHESLKENIGKYISSIEKLEGVDAATRTSLLNQATTIKDSLHSSYDVVTQPQVFQDIRNKMRVMESQLNKVADQSQVAGFKQVGSSISSGASSLKNKASNLFSKDGFKSLFTKSAPKTVIESTATGGTNAASLAANARTMRAETRLMAETSSAAGENMTFGKWVGARGKVLPDITLQEGVTGAIQIGAFALASKRAFSESKSAIQKLKIQHKDLTGEDISTVKLLFSSKIPETLKESRGNSLGKTAPAILGNFALFATTLFFQRRMSFAQIIGVQMGGGILLNGVMKKDFAGDHYAAMKEKFAAGEPLTAQDYVDQLAAMNRKTAKTGKIGDVDASAVAYHCAFNQTDPADVLRMIQASHKDKLAAKAWADEAQATIAKHNETQAKAAEPQPAVTEQPTLGQQAVTYVASNDKQEVTPPKEEPSLGQQAAAYVNANDRQERTVIGQHTAKVVKETARGQAAGAVLA